MIEKLFLAVPQNMQSLCKRDCTNNAQQIFTITITITLSSTKYSQIPNTS